MGYIAASSKKFDDRKSRYLEVENLGVIKGYRKQGVGAMLMDACLAWARDEGHQKAYLRCYSANVGAIEFYGRQGFESISVSLEKHL